MFRDVLKPTFLALSESSLLQRCFLGATQCQNECLNSLVRARCPKRKHHGYKAVRCAVASAVCHFHEGAESRLETMKRLSTDAGVHIQRKPVKKKTSREWKNLTDRPLKKKSEDARE